MKTTNAFFVEKGRLISYYPFKIMGRKNINKVRKKIQEDQIVISEIKNVDGCNVLWFKDKYIDSLEEKERNTLAFLVEDQEDGILKSFLCDERIKVTLPEDLSKDTKNILEKEDWSLSVGIERYNKINLRVESNSKNNLLYHLETIANKRILSKEVYGIDIIDYYTEYLLQPIYAKDRSGNDINICLSLQIYENGVAIIRADIPIINDNLKAFYDNEYDSSYKDIRVSKCIAGGEQEYNKVQINELSKVIGIYEKRLCEAAKVEMLRFAQFNHILFMKCRPEISNFGSISNETYEAIYRVLAAPLPEQQNIQNEMKLFCDKNFWGSNGIRYYFGKTGRCISITDEKLREFIRKKEFDDDRNVENRLQEMMEFNIEYCINILLLEYVNGKGRYWNNLKLGNNVEDIKKEYCETELMILEMKEYCFGSVLELMEQMEISMKYYLKKDLIDSKNENIEKIIYIRESKKKVMIKKFIEIVGFMYTFVFGLPAISETVAVLNKIFGFEVEGNNLLSEFCFLIWLVIIIAFLLLVLKSQIYEIYVKIMNYIYRCKTKEK